MIPTLLTIRDALTKLGENMANYVKCRSDCCNSVNIYTPNPCFGKAEMFNKWIRATTPTVDSPVMKKKDSSNDAFYTPRN